MELGLFAAHEQYAPTTLLNHAELAEDAGFDSVWTSDHFHPWWHTGAHCGAAWPWLGSALERTDAVRMGTGVTPPVGRYHPGLLAQFAATLGAMHPGRVHLTLATGEAMNERPLGFEWPDYPERRARMVDACRIVRDLFDGGFCDYDGHYWDLDGARLYTLPEEDVPVYVAGRGPHILGLGGFRGDGVLAGAGLASVDGMAYAREKIADGARKADRDLSDIDIVCWAFLSIADDRGAALDGVNPLVGRIVDKTPLPALEAIGIDPESARQVKAIDDVAALSPSELREHVPREVTEQFAIAGTPEECRAHVERLREAGVDHFGLLAFDNEECDERQNLELFSEAVIDSGGA